MSSAQSSNILGPLGRALSDDVLGAVVATARVIGALVLLFFVPGFLLINALYPRKGELDREYDALYRLTLGIVLSIAVTVFWSFFLNSLGINEATDLGYVVGPNIAGGIDRPLDRVLRPRMVARRVSLDGPRPPVARAGPKTRAGRAPDRRRARPSGAPQAPAARREARSFAAGGQRRRAGHAGPNGRPRIPPPE